MEERNLGLRRFREGSRPKRTSREGRGRGFSGEKARVFEEAVERALDSAGNEEEAEEIFWDYVYDDYYMQDLSPSVFRRWVDSLEKAFKEVLYLAFEAPDPDYPEED